MTNVRNPAVAGMFYPADPRELHAMIESYLGAAQAIGSVPKAIIAPHAGYVYSGSIAASAYVRLKAARGRISRVVLLGPTHHIGFNGLALSSADYFATPLGRIVVDQEATSKISHLPQVGVLDAAHAQEHSLEVHLPFLQEVLGEFRLVPLVVGDASPKEVDEVLDLLWDGSETLIVISTDLSHYHDYKTAQKLDRATSQAIEQLRFEDIQYDYACGRNPVNGLLYAARRLGLKAETVDLRNSGDTAGSHDRVVGYGAYVFE
ncbi:MAG: AmmeMemoRadiSam system protein B [Sulfuricaulis sp.]